MTNSYYIVTAYPRIHSDHSFKVAGYSAVKPCSAIFSNASLFVTFPSNKCLLSACVVMRSLTSACSRRSRFTVVETSPVNERTFQSCSCNILHGKHAPVKKASNKQEFLPTIFI